MSVDKRFPIIGAKPAAASSMCSTAGISAVGGADSSVVADPSFAGNVALVTLGCAKNLVDSEVMLGVLQQRGFRPINDVEQADLIVVNTCAFLQSAVEEGIDRILELSELRTSGRCKRLVVAGCMVERYRGDLKEALPEVDQFISTDELLKVGDAATSGDCFSDARRPYFLYDETMPRLRSTSGHCAFVKVAEGCNRPCTFCIIPKLRGSFRSRSIDSVSTEVVQLLQSGIREVTFVAQDLTAYGIDHDQQTAIKKPRLVELLENIDRQTAGFDPYWLRLLYAYPIGVDERLLQTMRDLPRVCNYLDLPLQHISAPVLKRMQRPLGARGTRALVETMRKDFPEIALRTTFIVGFPGETEEDVRELESFIAEGHFTHVGVFTYSQEEEAASFTFPEQVPVELLEERRARLMEVQQEIVKQRYAAKLGSVERVLVDGYHEETEMLLVGRTSWQGPETDGEVILNDIAEELVDEIALENCIGRFCQVRYTEQAGYDLVAEIIAVE
jgi:ribosomal protein S12 methylthiotransferase